MKTITVGGQSISLVEHAIQAPSASKQRFEAGRDAQGELYYKGRTGRWSRAYQTRGQAEAILALGTKMRRWWKFGGSNLQAVYGWGTREQAEEYAHYLNRSRDINHYYADPLSEDDDEATKQAGCVDIKAEGVDLDDEISALEPREKA